MTYNNIVTPLLFRLRHTLLSLKLARMNDFVRQTRQNKRRPTWYAPKNPLIAIFIAAGLSLMHVGLMNTFVIWSNFEIDIINEKRIDNYTNLDNDLEHRLLNSPTADAFQRLAILCATTPRSSPATKYILK